LLKNTPRYVIGSGDETYEFPIVRDGSTNPRAVVAVNAPSFAFALGAALDWAKAFTKSEQAAGGDAKDVFYPQVRYNHSSTPDRRLVKRIAGGMAWAENESTGAWLPLAVLGAV